jgi:two-component system KDP operon response regulator KdpE
MVTERPCILVIDDEPVLRESICEAFEDEGFNVVGAANGEDAVRALRNGHVPDLVLLDLDMPIMGGAEFQVWLREQSAPLGTTPVVLMSASDRVAQVARELRVEAFLVKPVLPSIVFAAVRRVLKSTTEHDD